ncbi:hypothetical protein [Variovorax sp. KK3]|uniref:hypothetical protein n=1 Tax=Variovorax sp. KK3 TaxID=1855728 RepID=UPI0011810778|nr:hypothetical protein [Variovorax sp. KK3]
MSLVSARETRWQVGMPKSEASLAVLETVGRDGPMQHVLWSLVLRDSALQTWWMTESDAHHPLPSIGSTLGPIRRLLAELKQVPISPTGQLDVQACDEAVRLGLAQRVESTVTIIERGLRVIELLLERAGPSIDEAAADTDSLTCLGLLMGELRGVAAACRYLAARCGE